MTTFDGAASEEFEWRVSCEDDETGEVSFVRVMVSAQRRADGKFRARSGGGEALGTSPRRAVLNLAHEVGWPVVSVHGPHSADPIAAALGDFLAAAEDVARTWDARAESGAYVGHTSDECALLADGAREVRDALRRLAEPPDDGREGPNG